MKQVERELNETVDKQTIFIWRALKASGFSSWQEVEPESEDLAIAWQRLASLGMTTWPHINIDVEARAMARVRRGRRIAVEYYKSRGEEAELVLELEERIMHRGWMPHLATPQ